MKREKIHLLRCAIIRQFLHGLPYLWHRPERPFSVGGAGGEEAPERRRGRRPDSVVLLAGAEAQAGNDQS